MGKSQEEYLTEYYKSVSDGYYNSGQTRWLKKEGNTFFSYSVLQWKPITLATLSGMGQMEFICTITDLAKMPDGHYKSGQTRWHKVGEVFKLYSDTDKKWKLSPVTSKAVMKQMKFYGNDPDPKPEEDK